MWNIGIDVGGTFTDLYAVHRATGEERTSKVLTTPDDRTEGVLGAIHDSGIAFASIASLVHGTTTATNALITRSYPEAALVTTEGFRDVLEIGRMHREHLYRPYQTKPAPLIRRRHRHTINERISADGRIVRPVERQEALAVIEKIERAAVRSVAICFLNSYANASNEDRMAGLIAENLPGVAVVTSSSVKPIFREHARFSTTAVRAVLLPVMASYFERLQQVLADRGFGGSLMILKSNGGMMSVEQAKTRVEDLVESGPAGGVAYAAEIARIGGRPNIIHTDMGGTSFDASIVENGRGLVTRDYEIEFDIPVAVPMLDIRSIGAGGGSVGWIDAGGGLRVGPASAGSSPGPACYGRGGTRATVTDANLVLNRLSSDLAGKFTLDRHAARAAVGGLADQVGLSIEQCAEGMIEIATEAMAQAVKIVLTSRGRDPRDYVLASFGGAGPLHAYSVAAALGIPRVICPPFSGVASAFGATVMDLRHDEELFLHATLDQSASARIIAIFENLRATTRGALMDQGAAASAMRFEHMLRLRYVGQTFEVDTGVPAALIADGKIADIADAFHRQHEIEFGVRSDDFAVELIAVAVTASAPSENVNRVIRKGGSTVRGTREAVRDVFFDGEWLPTRILDARSFEPGLKVAGPSIIDYQHTSAIVPPGGNAFIDAQDNLVLEVSAR